MTDIVERLRNVQWYEGSCDVRMAAAAEIERLRTVISNAKDELSRLRKAQEAHEETATKLNSYINLAGDQIDEINRLRKSEHDLRYCFEKVLIDIKFIIENNRVFEDHIYQNAFKLMTDEFMKEFNND